MDEKILSPLDVIVPGSNTSDLVSLEEISNGYEMGPILGKKFKGGNPKQFAWRFFIGSDYMMEAIKCFEGQVVVDLGAGQSLDGYILLNIVGARADIIVEPWNMHKLYQKITDQESLRGTGELNKFIKRMYTFASTISAYDEETVKKLQQGIEEYFEKGAGKVPAALVAEDIVVALKRLPSDSVSVLACGMDRCMISDDVYTALVEEQIARVLHPQGAYLGMCSRFEPEGLRKDEKASDKKSGSFVKYTK